MICPKCNKDISNFIKEREKELLKGYKQFFDWIPKSGKPVQVWREGTTIYIADPDRMFEKKELKNE